MALQPLLDFSTILASSVHDMKNSLGMVLFSLEEMIDASQDNKSLNQIHYDVLRVNNYLIQLLALYKMQDSGYPLNQEELYVLEFVEEQVARNRSLLTGRQLEIELDICPDLAWYFDQNLLIGVVNNILANAIRYSRKTLRILASVQDGMLCLQLDDDGLGYPSMLLGNLSEQVMGVDFVSGSTGFGLYFSARVARLHQNQDRQGYVIISNDSSLQGGRFSMYLP